MAEALVEVRTAAGSARFDSDEVMSGALGPERVGRLDDGRTVVMLEESLDATLASARPAAEAVVETFKALAPDEVSVEFGLRIDAQAGAVFAKAGVEAHFTVTLKWTGSHEAAPA